MLRNGLEPWHLLIVAIVVMVMFGSKKLPDTARALGKSMRILKSEAKAMKEDAAAGPASGTQTAEGAVPSVEPAGVKLSTEQQVPKSAGTAA
ncbi:MULTISPECIES: Sec-independent protein translocase subunit TatA [unclassified Streptomyces]|uniref:Sec-independent protein translocase subunit TatA n=1 Tax=unclassified Streptomyces TaxID=2593676 RepID=UPI002024A2A8|nr:MULTISPECIES: Sec-independent protein translocase subunit TatA [unclassified Streptomyces]MCX4549662.1 Sec-independent protein translocase subunit TatA [Streptomyces sp. NBC_01500]WSC21191.1 Sec-independent protein translocase subunit TatA [Streptomyces sp. NBC_01766]WSV55127.1 Sec-independent protein translocase subunit TatA [Streptomyces sp. NBC_01014]